MRYRLPVRGSAVIALILASAACNVAGGVRGSGNVITESRVVSGFSEIVLMGSGDVVVDVGGAESLTIEAEDNIVALLESEVRGGRLELGSKSSISPTRAIKYTVSAVALDRVSISGSGDITATNVDTESFEVEISGSGRVEPIGTASDLAVDIRGSGSYEGERLVAATGTVSISGSGDAFVNVTGDLDVSISGSGDVRYLGNPSLSTSLSGSGEVGPG